MPTVLDDDDIEIRDDDKTRQFVLPVRPPAADDSADGASKAAQTPTGEAAPERAHEAAAAPAVDASADSDASDEQDVDVDIDADLDADVTPPKGSPAMPAAPPPPPVAALEHRVSTPGETPPPDDGAPTIVIKAEAFTAPIKQIRREATVVVRRLEKRSRRNPMVAASIFGAVLLVSAAMGYAGYRRHQETVARERTIQQRIEALRRVQGP